MHVFVTDMYDAPKHFDDFDLFISILDPDGSEKEKFTFRGPRDKHFVAYFWDTEHPKEKEWMQMRREVVNILSWIRNKNVHDETKILVHCHAGVSRSSAIAWLIKVMHDEDPKTAFQDLFKARPQIWPNKMVLGFGADYLKLPSSFMKLVCDIDAEIATNHKEYLGYGG